MKIKITLLIILLIAVCNVKAQKKAAEASYSNYSYQEAIPKLKRLIDRDNKNGEALYDLANAYRLNGKTVEAELWFEKAVVYNTQPQCKLYYAQTLLSNSKYLKAKRWFEFYANSAPSPDDAASALKFADYCQELHDNGMPPHLFGVTETPFNTDKLDFSPAFFNENTIVFVSNRKYKGEKKDRWTGDSYLKLFSVNEQGGGQFDNPSKFFSELNTSFHEGPVVFTADGKKIYFTKNDVGKKRNYDKNKNTRLTIYSANYIDGKWEMPERLTINNSEYSVCHPALASDESYMIFASDMPGGYGGMDLYITKNVGNAWGVPENMGDIINTSGNEIFPFLDCSDNLFFASNMHVGLGGLDIFKAYNYDGEWTDIENIGAPINGPRDDFGLIIKCDYTGGYFSSNRKGEDNIYAFDQNVKIIIKKGKKKKDKTVKGGTGKNPRNGDGDGEGTPGLCGKVINKVYRNPLKNANVKMISMCSGEEYEFVTDENGYFSSDIDENCYYQLHASKKNFEDSYYDFSTIKTNFLNCKDTLIIPLNFINPFTHDTLTSDMPIINGMTIELYSIYFDLDKYYIRPDATHDLDVLLKLLNKYPNMRGTLGAHTDSRASFDYNITLSQNRAKSAMKYLTDRGIDPSRLKWKGYGETRLKNHCSDGVKCSKKEHQRNRRVEFQVTYFDGVINSKEVERWK